MVYHGKGFTWTELYHMPTWLRKFYLKKMEEALQQERKRQEESNKTSKKSTSRPNIIKPPRK